MVLHQKSFIRLNMIPLPKDFKVELSYSVNHRIIAIGIVKSKILNSCIIQCLYYKLLTTNLDLNIKL